MKKRHSFLLAFSFVVLFLFGEPMWAQKTKSSGVVVDEVVWIVGDEVILRSDIESQKLLFMSEGVSVQGRPDCFIPEQIAIQMLFLNQAKLDTITVEDAAINRYVESMINNMIAEIGSKERLEAYFNKPLNQIRIEQRKQMKNNEIARMMRQKIVGDIQVTPSEIRSFYASMPQDSLPYIPELLEVQLLRVEPDIALEEVDRVKGLLRDFSDQINRGDREFSMIARLYSEDDRTALQGGEYGFVSRSSLEQDFSRAVFNLNDTKRISPIVRTKQGFHIVQLIDKREDAVNFRHILIRPRVSSDELREKEMKMDSILFQIRSGKLTFDKAVSQFASNEDSRNNGGLLINADRNSNRSGSSLFSREELPQYLVAPLSQLGVGEITSPFVIKNEDGNTEIVLAKLKAVHPAHRANLNEDFVTIKEMALSAKQEKAVSEWIVEKQKETYIRVAPEYQNCSFTYPGWVR